MEYGGAYGFQHLPNTKLPCLGKKEIQEYLTKWSMIDGLKVQGYSFSKPFKTYLLDDFVQDFFACPAVTSTLERLNSSDRKFGCMGAPAEKIRFSEVKCTETTMRIFDKIVSDGRIVRKSGSIVKCVPEYFRPEERFGWGGDADGLVEIEVGDILRKVMVNDNDDDFKSYDDEVELDDVLGQSEREEFIFKLFSHLVIGGSLCQYEDHVKAYGDCTKTLYKDLISVIKSPSEDLQLDVVSTVCQIHSASNDIHGQVGNNLLFHKPQYNNFLYLIVHPMKQMCYTFYHHV